MTRCPRWSQESKGLVVSSRDYFAYMEHASAEQIRNLFNRSCMISESWDVHPFLQLKALSSFPYAPLGVQKAGGGLPEGSGWQAV